MNVYSLTLLVVFAALAGLQVDCKPVALSRSGERLPPSSHPKIIGGRDATDGQFPYMLELEYFGSLGWKHQCGAILLSSYYALTAARCVFTSNIINLRVFAGLLVRENYTLTNSQQISINNIKVHEGFSEYEDGTPNDIAVLRFAWEADLTRPNVAVATLPPDDSNNFNQGGCTIVGWGRYSTDVALAFTLQYAENIVITNNDCSERMLAVTYAKIWDVHVCSMSDPPGTAACQGDTGSPLICGPSETVTEPQYVVGLGSWTVMNNNYCNLNYPTVFTRISKFLDWITTNTPPYP